MEILRNKGGKSNTSPRLALRVCERHRKSISWQAPNEVPFAPWKRDFGVRINSCHSPRRTQAHTSILTSQYALITSFLNTHWRAAVRMSTWNPRAGEQHGTEDRTEADCPRCSHVTRTQQALSQRPDVSPTQFSDHYLKCLLATVWWHPDHLKHPIFSLRQIHLMCPYHGSNILSYPGQ